VKIIRLMADAALATAAGYVATKVMEPVSMKLYELQPLLEADQPPASIELRRALKVIDTVVEDYVAEARIEAAA
jgi:hypothetical protein